MTVYTITKGDNAIFTADFIDPLTRLRVVPPVTGGMLTIGYNAATVPVSVNLPLSASGVFWTATWDSTPADLGVGTWAVTPTGGLAPAASGRLRIVADP